MSAEKIITDIDVRNRSSKDLDTSFCIEAGAGTGKTTILVSRYLAIIESGRARCSEVVAITFTEKAATEMKLKITEEIERKLDRDDVDGEIKKRLQTALRDIERVPISTIHSFASMILREYPIEAGVDPYFEQMDQLQSGLFVDQCWEDYLGTLDKERKTTVRLFIQSGGKADKLREFSNQMLNSRGAACIDGLFKDFPVMNGGASGSGPSRSSDIGGISQKRPGSGTTPIDRIDEAAADSIEKLSRSFLEHLTEHAAFLRSLAAEYCKNREDKGFMAIEEFYREVKVAERIEGYELPLFLLGIATSAKGNKSNWDPPEKCTDQKEIFNNISSAKEQFKYVFSAYMRSRLVDFFKGFIEFVDSRKETQSILDFDDLLIRARVLLRNRDVLSRLKRRFKFILVDEFQDTDPLQAEIVYLLSLSDGGKGLGEIEPGKLFVVGDPKQSIYRFRGADVEAYEKFKDTLSRSGEVAGIIQNFRSVPGVIEWVNDIFSNVMKVPENGRYQSEYRAIEPFREGTEPSVIYLHLGDESSGMKKEDIRRIEGEAIARSIHRLIASGREVVDLKTGHLTPLRYSHIAVIYPVTTGIENYEDVLRAEGIPYIIEGGKLYYRRQEVRDITNAVWAIEDPTDSLALVSVLRSPLFGVSDEDLFLFVRSGGQLDYMESDVPREKGFDNIISAFALLKELNELRNVIGPAAVLKRLVEETNYFELCLLRPHGDQRVLNVKKVIQNAREFVGSGHSFRRFAAWVRKQEQETLAESESPLVEEDEDAVRILTIHKAKGLQFPVVFLANLVMGKSRAEKFYTNGKNSIEFSFGNLETEGYNSLKSLNEKREEAERARLLYVASTRAQDLLIVPIASKKNSYFSIIEPYLPGMAYGEEGRVGAKGPSDSTETGAVRPDMVQGAEKYSRAKKPSSESTDDNRGGSKSILVWRLDELPALKGIEKSFVKMPLLNDEMGKRASAEVSKWLDGQDEVINKGSRRSIVVSTTGIERMEGSISGTKALESEPLHRLEGEMFEYDIFDKSGDEGRRFGIAFHRLMEVVDLKNHSAIENVSKNLCAEYQIEGRVEELTEMASRTLDSSLMRRAVSSDVLHREVPFVFPVDSHFVTGRIDLIFREAGRWVIVDYKTDAVAADEVNSHALRYKLQGGIYALALRKIGIAPVGEVVFYFVRALTQSSLEVNEDLLSETLQSVRSALH